MGIQFVVRTVGRCVSFSLLEGALENGSFIQDYSCRVTTDFILEPNSHLLRMESTVDWNDEDTTLQMGDFGMVALEVSDFWNPQVGLNGSGSGEWHGLIGEHNDIALGIFSDDAPFPLPQPKRSLSTTGPVMSGFGPYITVAEGDSIEIPRYFGVGPDMAALSDEWLAAQGKTPKATAARSPVVVSQWPGHGSTSLTTAPMPPSQWHLQTRAVNGPPMYRQAGTTASWPRAAVERHNSITQRVLDTTASMQIHFKKRWSSTVLTAAQAIKPPIAVGMESSAIQDITASSTIELPEAGRVQIDNPDAVPTLVILKRTEDPTFNDSRYLMKFDGNAVWAYIQSESMTLPIADGDYEVVATEACDGSPRRRPDSLRGSATNLSIGLNKVIDLPELRVIDPHTHATPSGDGRISMANRLTVAASNGSTSMSAPTTIMWPIMDPCSKPWACHRIWKP